MYAICTLSLPRVNRGDDGCTRCNNLVSLERLVLLDVVLLDNLRAGGVDGEELVRSLFGKDSTGLQSERPAACGFLIALPLNDLFPRILEPGLNLAHIDILAPGFLSLSRRLPVLLRGFLCSCHSSHYSLKQITSIVYVHSDTDNKRTNAALSKCRRRKSSEGDLRVGHLR